MIARCVALALCLVTAAAEAADGRGRYFIMGPGKAPCRDFVAAKDAAGDHLYASWLTGYLTAVNELAPETYSIGGAVTGDQIMQAVGDFCRQNPDQLFAVAAESLVRALKPGRLAEAPR